MLHKSLFLVGGALFLSVLPLPAYAQRVSTSAAPILEASLTELPDSPGAVRLQSQDAPPPSTPSTSTSTPAQTQSPAAQPAPAQNSSPQRPVGTAAAEAPKVSGVSAAQPSGYAIAPAKQHRARSLVIKVGAIVGGAAALGTILALSEGTSSKPPGAH